MKQVMAPYVCCHGCFIKKKEIHDFFRVREGIQLHDNLFLKSTKSSMFGRELTSYNHSTIIPFFSLEAGSFLIFFFSVLVPSFLFVCLRFPRTGVLREWLKNKE